MNQYRAIDLFCGVGGLSAGLTSAGIDVVAAFDNWPVAVDTYCRNLGDHASLIDLLDIPTAVSKVSEYEPDLIAGGPPCQDFSSAGKRIEGDKANLTVAFAQIVDQCAPPFFLMENVPMVRFSAAYHWLKAILKERGYIFHECVLDASLCGVPQIRKRFFLFGCLDDDTTGARLNESISSSLACEGLTVKTYLDDEIDIEFYYRHPRNYARRAIFGVHEPSPTIRGVNRPVPPNYQRNHLDSADPESVRPLTSWERSRIQTFPPDWDWGTGLSDRNANIERLIGNAVPVQLGTFVGDGFLNAVAA